MNITFLAMAGIFNIYNWIRFTLSLKSYDRETKRAKKWRLKLVNILLPALMVLIVILYCTWFTISWFDSVGELSKSANDIIDGWSSVLFLTLAACFLAIGFYLKRELKLWNEEVEKQARCKINFAMWVLSIPFVIRAAFMFLRLILEVSQELDDSVHEDTWFAPTIYFLYIAVADLVPITSQLASMLVVIDEKDAPKSANAKLDKSISGKY